MRYVCDAPNGKTWFRIATEGEATHESRLLNHTVEKYFLREREKAVRSWRPERPNAIERDTGLEAHAQREMPLFLTLRDSEGNALTTAMLPPGGNDHGGFRIISVPHPMPILILNRARPTLRWQRISVSHSIATAASPTAAKEPDKYRYLIGAMSARGPSETCRFARMSGLRGQSGMALGEIMAHFVVTIGPSL
jgi:hypothetical protein